MKKLMFVVGVVLFVATGVLAQDTPQPKKYENVSWNRVVLVDYKPGQVGRVKEIIKIYKAAGVEAQTKGPEIYWFSTGEYDAMFIWPMDGGPADMEWWKTTRDIKWRTAMVKQMGSEEAADKLMNEFNSLVSSGTSYICRKEIN